MKKNNVLLVLGFLSFIFITPFLAAWFFVHEEHWPGMRVNRGFLFDPPVQLKKILWKNIDGTPFLWKNTAHPWVMLYVVPKPCQKTCHELIYKLHQIQLALNQDQDQFRRVFLFLNPPLEQEVKEIKKNSYARNVFFIETEKTLFLKTLEHYPGKDKIEETGAVFIVDPAQYIVLVYNVFDAQDILKDLQRLMRAYHLGQK